MAELRQEGEELVLHLSAFEKAEALHGDLRVPMAQVVGLSVVEDIVDQVQGLKLPGSRVPGWFAVGTFVQRGQRTFAVVHHDTPRGIRVRLRDAPYDQLLVGSADPEAVVAQLGGQVS